MKTKLMVPVLACLLFSSCLGSGGGAKSSFQKSKFLTDSARQNIVGLEEYQRGCWNRALEHFFRAHELAVAGDLAHDAAVSLNNIANAYRMLGEAESSAGFCSEAAGIFAQISEPEGERQALCNKAAALIALSRFGEAKKCLDEAESVQVEGGGVFVPLLVNRAVLALKMKDFAKAESLYKKALATPDGAQSAGVCHGMGVLMLETGRNAEAAAQFEAALDLDRQAGFTQGMADDLGRMGEALAGAGRKSEAALALKRAVLIYGLLGRAEDAEKINARLAPLAAETGVNLDVTGFFRDRWLGGGAYLTPCGK